jgi:hypothetical protein
MPERAAFRSLIVIVCVVLMGSDEPSASRTDDLDVAQREYVDKSPVFSPTMREQAHALIAGLHGQAAGMTDAQFALALARIAGVADNGHDVFFPREGGWRPKLRLPVRMIWFSDSLVIARAGPDAADLLGAAIVTIDGVTPAVLLERLRPLQGGVDGYRRWQLSWILHSPEALHALGVARHPDRLKLHLSLGDGSAVIWTIVARPAEEIPPGQASARFWIPAQWEGEREKGWRSAIDPASAPLYLQEPDALFRTVDLPHLDALYVQFRSNMDEGDAKIAPFVAAVAARLESQPPKNLILDLRFDTGGDNTQNRDLMRLIAQRVPGRIYALVGNYTFSAGIASAAALKHDGGDKVTIVGDAIGDRMHWWSEHGEPVCLPASKGCFSYNTGYWNLVEGCRDNPACYGDQFDLNVGSLEPTLPAPLTSRDWLANHDPGMAAIAADLESQRAPAERNSE